MSQVTKTLVKKMNETHLESNQEIKDLIENLNSRQKSEDKVTCKKSINWQFRGSTLN